jgi:glycosyltransferase involved in cell wall biosynthesis
MSNEQAIRHFQAAREHYLARRFAEARATMQRYRQAIDYAKFEQTDRRSKAQPEITVVIVSYQTNQALLDCLDSVFNQQGPKFEIILVDNGGNESIHTALAKLPLLWIKPPINLLPSEGRNIGAHFARGDLLVFLDDDALMASGYLAAACKTMADESILALRGRILPKTAAPAPSQPQQYDLGDTPQPAELNLEGNSVIRRKAYSALKGFDPLLFGHEGKELTLRCRSNFPNQKILYWPALVIHHDYAQEQQLATKRERQALAKDYLHYLKENTLSAGVTILVRAGDNLAAANDFLASLVKHNTYKPVEVLLWAKDSQQTLATSRSYLARLFVRVLPASTNTLGRIGQQARYDNLLIVDLPTQITNDVVSGWLQSQQTNQNTTLLCSKQQFSTLADTALTTELNQLANKLGKPMPKLAPKAAPKPAQQAKQPPQPEKPKAKPAAAPNNPQAKPQPKPELTQKISQIEAQIAQIDADIANLESQYLPLPENTPEKQALKGQLEDKVLASCRLLIDLKDAQDNLQEIRIRSICGTGDE